MLYLAGSGVSAAKVKCDDGIQRFNLARAETTMVYPCCRDPNAAQISQLRQQLAAAKSELSSLKQKLASSQDGGRPDFDCSVAPKSSDAIMALALDEMQQQNSALDVDNARLKVELVSSPMGLTPGTHSVANASCQFVVGVCCAQHATYRSRRQSMCALGAPSGRQAHPVLLMPICCSSDPCQGSMAHHQASV